MNQEAQNRRRRYFIDKSFQSKYVALLLLFIVALGVAGLLIVYLGGGETTGPREINKALMAMLMVIILFVVFTAWYGIRFSHRVVGPIYAFNRHMNWIKDGNFTRDIKLRDHDEFKNLATVFNNMQASMRDRVRENIDALAKVEAGLNELSEIIGQDGFNKDRALEMLKNQVRTLEANRVKNQGFITQ